MPGRGDGAFDGRHLDNVEDVDEIEAIGEVDASVERLLADGVVSTTGDADDAVATMRRLRALADEPLPAASRRRHLDRIRTHEDAGRQRTAPRGAATLRRRFTVVAAASVAVLMLTAGSAVALAQGAEPEDLLYGVKRASEQAWLAVPRGPERSAEVHLALAERRLGEARRSPAHAERLVAEGIENAEVAADELPAEAVENLRRLLGDGPDSLPANASPAARGALHRNCVRISERHDLGPEQCGPAPVGEHPGRGMTGEHPGQGRGLDGEHPGQGRGLDGEHPGDASRGGPFGDGEIPRGWGAGGRPEGAVGPPPGTPGYDRWQASSEEPVEE